MGKRALPSSEGGTQGPTVGGLFKVHVVKSVYLSIRDASFVPQRLYKRGSAKPSRAEPKPTRRLENDCYKEGKEVGPFLGLRPSRYPPGTRKYHGWSGGTRGHRWCSEWVRLERSTNGVPLILLLLEIGRRNHLGHESRHGLPFPREISAPTSWSHSPAGRAEARVNLDRPISLSSLRHVRGCRRPRDDSRNGTVIPVDRRGRWSGWPLRLRSVGFVSNYLRVPIGFAEQIRSAFILAESCIVIRAIP
ncbi:hypothetical protein B296_00000831 [Ensete ventricosum]|uniref:Uncharacterized protein n=1 Tax=Ensete ventricosum TaxID=4639 RepID=A0A427B7U7_ENSVE|nr:hypothetical protein B296_00000831 [Ensete ventricosum]